MNSQLEFCNQNQSYCKPFTRPFFAPTCKKQSWKQDYCNLGNFGWPQMQQTLSY